MPRFQGCSSIGSRGLLLAGLLLCAAGCAVEDRVARVISSDAGSGPLSVGDEDPDLEWAPPEEGALADCSQPGPDAGVPCADAGTAEE